MRWESGKTDYKSGKIVSIIFAIIFFVFAAIAIAINYVRNGNYFSIISIIMIIFCILFIALAVYSSIASKKATTPGITITDDEIILGWPKNRTVKISDGCKVILTTKNINGSRYEHYWVTEIRLLDKNDKILYIAEGSDPDYRYEYNNDSFLYSLSRERIITRTRDGDRFLDFLLDLENMTIIDRRDTDNKLPERSNIVDEKNTGLHGPLKYVVILFVAVISIALMIFIAFYIKSILQLMM